MAKKIYRLFRRLVEYIKVLAREGSILFKEKR